jgi:hypothetical protein
MGLHKEEVEGILDTPVTVQEKVDGANVSIWLGEDGIIKCGSRTRELGDDAFNGFTAYVKEHEEALLKWFTGIGTGSRLYGEWLVKHTITYPDEAYKKMYLFDIYDEVNDMYEQQTYVKSVAERFGFEYPQIFVENAIVTKEQIDQFVGKSFIGANGEGVVIKNSTYKNKWGNHVYAKAVHQNFKESNAIVFGGNNKHSETYWEMYVVNKYCTLSRVQKIMQKLQPEVNERLDMKHTPEVTGRAFYDLITEEIWEIVTKVPSLDFKTLKNLCGKKFRQIYHDILNNAISIADTVTA